MRTDSRFSRNSASTLRIAALAAVPLLLGSIPMSLFERLPKVCVLRRMGIPCWGCGMTRAVASASRADFGAAWRYNRLSVVVVPILGFLWWRRISREIERR
ncbi:MAG TPA: DUF2752 domain-containing protein [Thermoanaerobaculia bacterium]